MEKYLPNCIESIISQTYSDWELILVDDGSPDRSGEIADMYAERDSRIKVIHQKNAGVAAARNSGVDIATGEYISFLDGDDFLSPDYITDLLKIAKDNNADIVQCGLVRGNEIVFPPYNGKDSFKKYDLYEIFQKDVANIIVCAKLIRSEILKTIRIPEGRYFEDDLVTWRWYYSADRIVVSSRPYYYYTQNDNSQMARHKKKPNLSFIDIYNERINFFIEINEADMEECSRRQLCKALVLTYSNPNLSKEDRKMVKECFDESYAVISFSKYLTAKLKLLLLIFHFSPLRASKLANSFK